VSRARFGSLRSHATALGVSEPRVLVGLILLALALGGVLHLLVPGHSGDLVWAIAIAVTLVPLTWSVLRSVARGDVGVDAIALVAMAGALALGEYLAGAVIALMLSGGNALEAAAGRRARRELTALLERAPRIAHRRRGDRLEEIAVEEVRVGDRIFVRAGEVVPVDGAIESEGAVVDESTLTGEPLPVRHGRGTTVASGTVNAGEAFDLRATRTSAQSAYAGIVKLVRGAERQRAPFVRMADRYAAILLPVTLVVAGAAWALSGDPVRALAVLVVATPCPLILAAPVALISGVSRAARRGIIVKGGATIEKLGRARTVLFDKTGTLTHGRPEIEAVRSVDGLPPEVLLRLAASVDQLSAHVLAEALVHGAEGRGIELLFPEQVVEDPGQGIEGSVDGHRVAVGSADWLRKRGYSGAATAATLFDGEIDPGWARVLIGVDGALAGAVVMADRVREDAGELTSSLRAAGIDQIGLVTGDQKAVGEAVGRSVGVDRVYAERSPKDKIAVVREAREQGEHGAVVMVGDGVNDAPALALADVGIAMGSAGATVSSETADAVIALDRVDRVVDAIRIGRRSLGIARQSVLAGLGMSFVAMGFAAFGYIQPVAGALLQEGIDVAVILNALRALRG
jgi:ATPase, P-type (transporting), HAD superfamily, subfamily IC/ATPase, P-type (transporting), HAD superfamily, subfamily IC/heavy metal translocating P-type ATPase